MSISASEAGTALLAELREGKHLAIARAITAIENETSIGYAVMRATRRCASSSRSVGVTGPPGAGKSSLISALVAELAGRQLNIGVVTVDPSSRSNGGAVLGDRVRMASHSRNPRVFIRSLASRGHLGGVTLMTGAVMDVLSAAQMDLIIVETVGTGQSELDIRDLVDVTLVLCPPGLGDGMQAIKAGILEIADILVVNKCDTSGAQQTAAELNAMLKSRPVEDRRAVMLTDALTGAGVADLAGEMFVRLSNAARKNVESQLPSASERRKQVAQQCASWIRELVLGSVDPRVDAMAHLIEDHAVDIDQGIRELIRAALCEPRKRVRGNRKPSSDVTLKS